MSNSPSWLQPPEYEESAGWKETTRMTDHPIEERNRHRRELLTGWAILLLLPTVALILFVSSAVGPVFWQIMGATAIVLAVVLGYLFAGNSRL